MDHIALGFWCRTKRLEVEVAEDEFPASPPVGS